MGQNAGVGLIQTFRENAGVADDRHEIRVAGPSRNDVDVQMVGNSGPGRGAEVHAHVESMRTIHGREGFHPGLNQRHHIGHFIREDARQVRGVPERCDHQVSVCVRVGVEHQERLMSARQHPVLSVGDVLRDAAEETTFQFVARRNEFHTPGSPQTLRHDTPPPQTGQRAYNTAAWNKSVTGANGDFGTKYGMEINAFDGFLRATLALFIILDPIGLLPVVMALTSGQETHARQRVLYLSGIVAFVLMVVLTFTAKAIFQLYGITMADFQIAGGLVLFGVAVQTINERHWGESVGHGAGIVPIACPLLVGPGAVATSILALDRYGVAVTLLAIVAAFAAVMLCFRFTNSLYRLLGETGAGVVARLMGMLLAAIAVQFIHQGVVEILKEIR